MSSVDVRECIKQAIEELNLQLPEESQLSPQEDTVIIGEGAELDSLGILNLIINVEQEVGKTYEKPINLAEELMSQNQPVGTIKDLETMIKTLL